MSSWVKTSNRNGSSQQVCLALVTAPDKKTARRLARAALEAHLAACANLVPAIESHYWWQGKLELAAETLIIFKTTRRRQLALERLIVKEHPYDTPEYITFSIKRANARYLDWWVKSCR